MKFPEQIFPNTEAPGIHQSQVLLPVGAITAFAGYFDPSDSKMHYSAVEAWGWIPCDGRKLQVKDFPELFNALGHLYGGSDGTFAVPDLRGMFLRGIAPDESKNSPPKDNPYKGSLENRQNAHGKPSSKLGSTQLDAMQTHMHSYKEPTGATPGKSGDAFAAVKPDLTGTPTDNLDKAPGKVKVSQYETRPANMFVYYLIKYTYAIPAIEFPIFNSKF